MWGMRIAACTLFLLVAMRSMAQQPTDATAKGYVQLLYANDFFTATDRYYTQGVRLEYGSPLQGRWITSRLLLKLADEAPLNSVFVQQDCYTPNSIRTDTIRLTDRPFAAAIHLGFSAVTLDHVRGLRMTSTLITGLLGPCASCEEEQKWIHHGLGNIEPLGWQYQLHTAPILNYSVVVEKQLVRMKWMEVSGGGNATAGTLLDALGTMLTLRIGTNNNTFIPERQRPHRVMINAFAKGHARFVAYDATMQGGAFQHDDPHVLSAAAIDRGVLGYELGGLFSYRKLDLTYAETYITRTFKDGLEHAWGMLRIRAWF